jgi:hypothetical protein
MTGLCLVAGLLMAPVGDAITLRWTHSIEKIVWEEDYRYESGAMRLVEARVRGTGAGMEPPAGAVLRDGSWHYTPALPLLPSVRLTQSPFASPYVICSGEACKNVESWLPGLSAEGVFELRPCGVK